MGTIKTNCKWFLGRLSTKVMTLLLIQIHSETYNFLSTKVIWERENRGLISYLSAWGSDRHLKNTAQPEKRYKFMKNGNESRDVLSDLWLRYHFPWAEIGKYGPRKEPIRLHDSLPCPLKKSTNIHCDLTSNSLVDRNKGDITHSFSTTVLQPSIVLQSSHDKSLIH